MNSWFRRLSTLVKPNLPEPIEIAQWKRYERLGLWIPPFLMALNVLGLWSIENINAAAYRIFLAMNLPAHVLLVAVNGYTLSRAKTQRGHRISAMISVVLLHFTSVSALWLQSDGGRLLDLVLMLMTIVFYRLGTDGRLGFFAFLVAMVLCGGLVALKLLGVVHSVQLRLDLPLQPEPPGLLLTGWFWSSALAFLCWTLTSYVANRFRAASWALSMERQQARKNLDAAMVEAGHGRLTGSVLRESYRMLELLGRGGMGEVYEAQRLDDGRRVAIKVLFPHLAEQTQMLERFRREALAARRLPLACAPEVLDVGETPDGTHYIVMERLFGEDLAALLRRRGKLEPDEVGKLLDHIAAALDAAHAQAIVHRDLKPQNVFLVESGDWPDVRLLDFGIARLRDGIGVDTITADAVVLGSPGFLAPEQARGDSASIGPHTDVFALGAILYRALTGVNGFPSRNAAQAIYEAIHYTPIEPSKVRPDLPAQLDAVIAQALAKDPAQRYASAGELAREFAKALSGEPRAGTPTLTLREPDDGKM